MGIPLLIIGTSAGRLLPRAGPWMKVTNALFGMGLLAVAVWLLGRILPPSITLALWAILLLSPLLYLGWRRHWKGAALVGLSYGILLLAGVATDRKEPFQPLLCSVAVACEEPPGPAFQKIGSQAEWQQRLAEAGAQQRWVMLEVYAEWCTACQEMDHSTFADPKVRAALAGTVLVQADVTPNSAANQAFLKHFALIGPPATLFFGPDRQERQAFRVIGYMAADPFLRRLGQVFR